MATPKPTTVEEYLAGFAPPSPLLGFATGQRARGVDTSLDT